MSEKPGAIEAAFEKYRAEKYGAYASYPIEAFTHFCAGYKAAPADEIEQLRAYRQTVSSVAKAREGTIEHLRAQLEMAMAQRDAVKGQLESVTGNLEAVASQLASARKAAIEECAKVLDDAAQDLNRIRDPGMANNARSYANKLRKII